MGWDLPETHLRLKGLTPAITNELAFILQGCGALRAPFLGSAQGWYHQQSLLQLWDPALLHLPSRSGYRLTCPRSTHATSPDVTSLGSDVTAS